MSNTEQTTDLPGLAEIEPVLFDLQSATAMLGHMAASKLEVDSDQLNFIESQLIHCHRKLDAMWKRAWEDRRTERDAHRAALAAAEARAQEAAPGSVAQMKRVEALLWLLEGAGKTTVKVSEEMAAEIKTALAERCAEVEA